MRKASLRANCSFASPLLLLLPLPLPLPFHRRETELLRAYLDDGGRVQCNLQKSRERGRTQCATSSML